MLLQPHSPESALRAVPPAPLPIAQLVVGQRVEDVVALLPRLFNLCRAAQETAVCLALGLPAPSKHDLHREIRREHMFRLGVVLPAHLGLAPFQIPSQSGQGAQVFFAGDRFPDTVAGFSNFLEQGQGIASLLSMIARDFAPADATSGLLPAVCEPGLFDGHAMENSVAARHLDHPVLFHIESQYGRGPLWRTVARAVDLQAILDGDLPEPSRTSSGIAMVPAARGIYAVEARAEAGKVTHFRRVTPTDHMLATNGIMQRSLATLPADKHDKARLLVDILDPCSPVQLVGCTDA